MSVSIPEVLLVYKMLPLCIALHSAYLVHHYTWRQIKKQNNISPLSQSFLSFHVSCSFVTNKN